MRQKLPALLIIILVLIPVYFFVITPLAISRLKAGGDPIEQTLLCKFLGGRVWVDPMVSECVNDAWFACGRSFTYELNCVVSRQNLNVKHNYSGWIPPKFLLDK